MSELLPRITEVLNWSGLGPAAFADEIGVARPVMSHIMSARNKASLEVVQKILDRFSELSPAWLLSGKGAMLTSLGKENVENGSPRQEQAPSAPSVSEGSAVTEKAKVQKEQAPAVEKKQAKISSERKLMKIVLFFSDGHFESFDPS